MKSAADNKSFAAALLLILAATCLVYSPALNNGFTNWDDDLYVTENYLIRDLSWPSVLTMFNTFQISNYHPLTLLSYSLDYRLFGLAPAAYHFTNLVLHLVVVCLACLLILQVTKNRPASLLAALLFSLHPINVEAVAWISSRKTLLAAIFCLLSLRMYIRNRMTKRRAWWFLSFIFFILANLAKPTALSVPFLLLLLRADHGERPRFGSRLASIAPFFAIGIFFAVLTFLAQKSAGAVAFGNLPPLFVTWLMALRNIYFGVVKIFYPAALSAFYPFPDFSKGLPFSFFSVALITILALLLLRFLRPSRNVTRGILFFTLASLPTSQIIPFGKAVTADRYAYLPSIGIFLGLAAGIAAMRRTNQTVWKRLSVFVPLAAAAVLGAATHQRVKVWQDGETLWNDAVAKQPEASMAYAKRGEWRMTLNKVPEAIEDFRTASSLAPADPLPLTGLGLAYARLGDLEQAISFFSDAIALSDIYFPAYINRGNAYAAAGKFDGALRDYEHVISRDSRNLPALFNRGLAYQENRQWLKADADYARLISLYPAYIAAYLQRANLLWSVKLHDAALSVLVEALRLEPENHLLLNALGNVQSSKGDFSAAAAAYSEAIKLQPGNAELYYNRGLAYRKWGKPALAEPDFAAAAKINPQLKPPL